MSETEEKLDGAAPKPKSDSAVKKEETEEKPDGAAPKPESDSAVKKKETEENLDGAAQKPESNSAVKKQETEEQPDRSVKKPESYSANEETVEKTKTKIKPDVCDVPEKLCETDEKSGVMEPKQTESETEAQKSDVCNEINKSDAVEQPEKIV